MFGQIADSRAKLAGAKTPEQTIEAANQQSAALSRLLVVVENYPQLRSNEQFGRLMDELSGTENRIAVERMRYNEQVQAYNTSRRQFPSNVTAGIFGFKEYPCSTRRPKPSACQEWTSARRSSDGDGRRVVAGVRSRDDRHAQAARTRAGRSVRLEAAPEVDVARPARPARRHHPALGNGDDVAKRLRSRQR